MNWCNVGDVLPPGVLKDMLTGAEMVLLVVSHSSMSLLLEQDMSITSPFVDKVSRLPARNTTCYVLLLAPAAAWTMGI